MSVRSFFIATILLITSPVYAVSLYKFANQPLTINRCVVEPTENALDLALINDGYFVVSHGKKDSELLFTRYGSFFLDADNYIRTISGDYLIGINKKSETNKLSKLKISGNNLPPKATSKVGIVINLPAMAVEGESYLTKSVIYDSISGAHTLTVEHTKISSHTWSTQVFVDDIKLIKGKLIFGKTGKLSKQEGLTHIQWPTDYGLNDLTIDYATSTAYASPFNLQSIQSNGYKLGLLIGLEIDKDGGIFLLYNNGQYKGLKNHIAVAKFTNPSYLEFVIDHLYRSTEKSGPQRVHRVNSQHAILSGYLEQEPCFKN